MFTIYGGNTEFKQWEQGQRVVESNLVAGDKVVFLNSSGMTLPMKAYTLDGEVVVDVPNKLLTMALPILVYICGNSDTETIIPVVAQDKPENYVFVDNDDWKPDATSWNDLTDKPFYEEQGKVLFECMLSNGSASGADATFVPEVGKTYAITTDSGTELGVCTDGGYTFLIDAGSAYYACHKSAGMWSATDENGGNTFIVSEPNVVHPIEPKFIPGAVLPVLTINNIESREMTTEEAAFMDAVVEAKTPFILKGVDSYDTTEVCCVMNISRLHGTLMCYTDFSDGSWIIGSVSIYKSGNDGDGWQISYGIRPQP